MRGGSRDTFFQWHHPGEMPGQHRRVIPPPVLFLICLIAGSVLQSQRPVLIGPYSMAAGLGVGVLLLAAAGVLGGWALREMMTRRTPVEPWEEPVHLVTSGPFRISRNPLYVTLTAILLSIAVMANSLWLLASAVLLLLLLDTLVVRREEKILIGVFGDAYLAYKARVRRWV
ncbi:MAG TPA: isoprenylcysteine carboxylmethyltransferase family protein [Thermoanaerobaculia bacterium]|nr:isoprenylcysteine carboxylmethyltransferase family protein [Thermoanaerobaculia bacterium]